MKSMENHEDQFAERAARMNETFAEREARMDEMFAAYRSAPKEYSVSAMPVVITYMAIIGRVEYFKRGEEPVFQFTRTFRKGNLEFQAEEVPENAYAIRDEFLRVKTPEQAPEFLRKNGEFSPLSDSITWSEFRRWQRFAYLVQEHNQLAAAMNDGLRIGECAEILKALTGYYHSSFFDGSEIPQTPAEAEFDARIMRDHPEIHSGVKEGELHQERSRRELWGWFRQPPEKACSIEWIPKSQEAEQAVMQKMQAGGAMIEYLLPQEQLQPVLFIRPQTTLQAIAAAIYADRIQGVKYRTCDWCGNLFPIGGHNNKKYCDNSPCKGNAHKQRTRKAAKERKEAELAAQKPRKDEAKKARPITHHAQHGRARSLNSAPIHSA